MKHVNNSSEAASHGDLTSCDAAAALILTSKGKRNNNYLLTVGPRSFVKANLASKSLYLRFQSSVLGDGEDGNDIKEKSENL